MRRNALTTGLKGYEIEFLTHNGTYGGHNMSFETVAKIFLRCYGRVFDDWDRDSWSEGDIRSRFDADMYCVRKLLDQRLCQ